MKARNLVSIVLGLALSCKPSSSNLQNNNIDISKIRAEVSLPYETRLPIIGDGSSIYANPVVKAEELRFSNLGIFEVPRGLECPYSEVYNTLSEEGKNRNNDAVTKYLLNVLKLNNKFNEYLKLMNERTNSSTSLDTLLSNLRIEFLNPNDLKYKGPIVNQNNYWEIYGRIVGAYNSSVAAVAGIKYYGQVPATDSEIQENKETIRRTQLEKDIDGVGFIPYSDKGAAFYLYVKDF